MKPVLIYCFDAYCGWCYGFSAVMKKIVPEYSGMVEWEILSGGMIRPDKPTHIDLLAPMIREEYRRVEQTTGVSFGADFLWHIYHPDQSDWYPDSLKPAIALGILKDHCPDRMFEAAFDLQYALNYEGRDLTDDEAYRHLLPKYGITDDVFYERLHSSAFSRMAIEEFNIVKRLNIGGYPALIMQTPDRRFHWVASGYTPYETVRSRIDNLLATAT